MEAAEILQWLRICFGHLLRRFNTSKAICRKSLAGSNLRRLTRFRPQWAAGGRAETDHLGGVRSTKADPFVRNTVINTSLKYTYLSPLVREKDIGSQEIRSRASADSIPESGLVQYAFGLLQQPWHVGHFEPQYALWVRRNSQQINPIGGKKPWTPHKRSGVLSGNDWSDVLMGQDWSWHDRGIWGLGSCGWHDPGIFFFFGGKVCFPSSDGGDE